ncbi:hypothetical protein KUTeg_009998, partial [Tegillarca granosa]
MKKIAIVGAGCSGLAAIKCCLDEGLEPVCFEREIEVGGLWNYTENPKLGKGSVYKNCVINTSKEMMAYSDFPPPEQFPTFMPHSYVLKYFKLYAENFGLYKYINFETSVQNIRPTLDYKETGRWEVVTCKKGHNEVTETFDGVLICTGHHTYPNMPTFRGLDVFNGQVMHSHSYRENSKLTGKRVLVVGIGNSAVDIAVDASHTASQVYLSTRRGAWVISRKGFWGLPADAMANSRFVFSLPKSFLGWGVEKMSNLIFDHEGFGLKPKHGAFQAHPTINDELPFRIMVGAVRVKPNIYEFTENKVRFEDGSCEEIDVVVFATGYNYKLSFLDKSVTCIDKNNTCLYEYMFPPELEHPTLGIVGLVQAIGAVMPISEMQCRWYTRLIKGLVNLPSKEEMYEDIDKKRDEMSKLYISTQRHTIQFDDHITTFWIEYMDEIANKIGVKPDFKKLFLDDPWLALRCIFGPCFPAQYRLHGPGKWNGAKPCIQDAMKRCMSPNRAKILPKNAELRTKNNV